MTWGGVGSRGHAQRLLPHHGEVGGGFPGTPGGVSRWSCGCTGLESPTEVAPTKPGRPRGGGGGLGPGSPVADVAGEAVGHCAGLECQAEEGSRAWEGRADQGSGSRGAQGLAARAGASHWLLGGREEPQSLAYSTGTLHWVPTGHL